ncbi:MAG: serpin family protein [Phycisphaerae bacterium]|nr:serpin family protein [Phycisphaerae bacterium]
MAKFVDGMNGFGLQMYGQLAEAEGNLFFSPLSLHAALSMTSVGARGETHAEMAAVLGLPGSEAEETSPAAVGAYYKAFLGKMLADAARVKSQQLSVANGLWLNKKFSLVKGFDAAMRTDFQAEAGTADFADTKAAAKVVNDWVAKKTNNRVKDIISPAMLNRDTVLLLANALYFKGAWAEEFGKANTADGEFKLGGDKTVKAKMMSHKAEFDYAETDDAQVLAMPYAGHQFSMVIVLPKKVGGLAELEKNLSADSLAAWTTFESEDVRVTLPRFKVTRDFDARKPLEAMGMTKAFSREGGADFSGMVADEKVAISFVVHKAFVAVDEVGTEAAAATVVGIARAMAPLEPKEPKEFKADHPFLFMIRHNQTGAILFIGRVADPTKE